MPWTRVNFAPGITKDVTRYGADGTWYDCNLVRFRNGAPERWGGWVRYLADFTMNGVCRSMHRWAVLSGYIYLGLGTNSRFYVVSDDLTYEVSPLTPPETLTDPFTTTDGSSIVTVTTPGGGHTAVTGDTVIFAGATAVGGLTIDGEYVVIGYINDNNYQIDAGSDATSDDTGGGTVTVNYIFAAGSVDQADGGGWGADTWGQNEWGGSSVSAGNLGLWSQDNWGEDLVGCIYDGPIFYWFASTPDTRMINIRDLPGADGNAPTRARFIAISHKDRHLLAFGVGEEFGGDTYAPMTVRWCSQENIYNWNEADETGTAGSLPLSNGSRFLAVQPTQAEILVWSDAALFSMQFTGTSDVYIANIVEEASDIAGANASCVFGTSVYWMGRSGFYVYDGRVTKVPNTVWNYISSRVNWSQANKIYAAPNKSQDEIIWYYPSLNGSENDSYVAYNVVYNFWMVGSLERTAWLDMDFQYQPLAASAAGTLYYHDVGMDDGSQTPPAPLNAYIESAPLEMASDTYNKGDKFTFIRRILPDVTFLDNDGVNTPTMNIVLKMMDKPGGGFKSSSSSQVAQTAIIPVEEFTEECHVRLRGRSMTIRLESNSLGSQWRSGLSRFDIRTDGQR